MSNKVDDTIECSDETKPVAHGLVRIKHYAFVDLPDPSTMPEGTVVAITDQMLRPMVIKDGAWQDQVVSYEDGSGLEGTVLASVGGYPAWIGLSSFQNTLSISLFSASASTREVGNDDPIYVTYLLSRAPASAYRPDTGPQPGSNILVIDGVEYDQGDTTNPYVPDNWGPEDVFDTRTYDVIVSDGPSTPLAVDPVIVTATVRVHWGRVTSLPDIGDVDSAYIAGLTYYQLMDSAGADIGNYTIALSATTDRIAFVYPVDLPQPTQVLVTGIDTPFTNIGTVPYTNTYGATYDVNVYVTDELGYVGSVYLNISSTTVDANYSTVIGSDRPRVWWRFQLVDRAADWSGNANHYSGPPYNFNNFQKGTNLIAATGVVQGTVGAFTMSDNAGSLGYNKYESFNNMPSETSFSVEAWFQIPAAAFIAGGDLFELFGFQNVTRVQIEFGGLSSNHAISSTGSPPDITSASNSITADTPIQIVVTIDSGIRTLYINGALVAAVAHSSPFTITQFDYVSSLNLAGLRFDDFIVYAGPLTAQQVLDHYNAGIGA